jgi:hypothetical protein
MLERRLFNPRIQRGRSQGMVSLTILKLRLSARPPSLFLGLLAKNLSEGAEQILQDFHQPDSELQLPDTMDQSEDYKDIEMNTGTCAQSPEKDVEMDMQDIRTHGQTPENITQQGQLKAISDYMSQSSHLLS